MQILEVRLAAAAGDVEELRDFYGGRVGTSVIEFDSAEGGRPFYHFALRVPRDRFEAARDWLADRAELLADESGDTTFLFENWNAEACYAHDPAGNIVELIAHHELPEESPAAGPFRAAEILGVCEVGLVGPDVRTMARALQAQGIELWDGTVDEPGRLAFMGGRDGVLILSPAGRGWVPTGRPAEVHAAEVVVAGAVAAEIAIPGTPHRVHVAVGRR